MRRILFLSPEESVQKNPQGAFAFRRHVQSQQLFPLHVWDNFCKYIFRVLRKLPKLSSCTLKSLVEIASCLGSVPWCCSTFRAEAPLLRSHLLCPSLLLWRCPCTWHLPRPSSSCRPHKPELQSSGFQNVTHCYFPKDKQALSVFPCLGLRQGCSGILWRLWGWMHQWMIKTLKKKPSKFTQLKRTPRSPLYVNINHVLLIFKPYFLKKRGSLAFLKLAGDL